LLFQFQYGAIDGDVLTSFAIIKQCFNSNMVRLMVRTYFEFAITLKFQFQYGAIDGNWGFKYT